MEHHDDALPSGTTAQTATVLDADCEPVEVTCPCGDASVLLRLYNSLDFDGPQQINTGIEDDTVFYNARDSLDSIPHNPQLVFNASTRESTGVAPSCIYSITDEMGTFIHDEEHFFISLGEYERCREDIINVIEDTN